MNSAADIWAKVLSLMEAEMTATTIKTFFDDTEAVLFDGDNLILYTPGAYKREMIRPRYLPVVERALRELFSADISVELTDEAGLARYRAGEGEKSHFLPGTEEYSFDNFVVGPSNHFAFAGAKNVAENPGKHHNPLFIYGQSGLGKTHLLYAIAHTLRRAHPEWRILYCKSEEFVNELVQVLRRQESQIPTFREKYRNVDVFLMDDVQFIAGKEVSELELFNTFNVLHESKKQIVFTSDRPPADMLRLEDRLRTRFEWGLQADILPPDYETRVGIIKNKAIARGKNLPEPVLQYIAENITSNVRQIEGTVNKILALQELDGRTVDVDTTIRAVRDMLRNAPSFLPSPDIILNEVAGYFNLDPKLILGRGKRKNLTLPRNIAMYLIRSMTGQSLQEVAQMFDGRDHTTVISNISNIEAQLETDARLADTIKDITTQVNGRLSS